MSNYKQLNVFKMNKIDIFTIFNFYKIIIFIIYIIRKLLKNSNKNYIKIKMKKICYIFDYNKKV